MKNILKYLRNTKDMVLVYGAKPKAELKVSCYADASFQADKNDTKSQTRYVFVLNGRAVDWKSAKQSTTTMSSTEAKECVLWLLLDFRKDSYCRIMYRTPCPIKGVLREVIELGDSYEAPKDNVTTGSASDGTGKKKGRTVTLTTDDMQKRQNDTFSGNEATKKTKKNLLKQQYGNFKAEGSETLEKTFNRLQEDMDIKWNMALLSIRADRFWKKTRKKITIQGTDVAGFDKSMFECFNCHKMGHYARECMTPKALMAIDGVGWDWSYMANDEKNHALVADEEAPTEFALMAKTSAESEVFDNSLCFKAWLSQVKARLAEHRNQKVKYCEKIRILEFKVESRANCIESLTKELELIKKEKEGLDSKLAGFQTASKDLDSLLEKFADDTVTNYSRPSPAIESTLDDTQNKNPSVTKTEASPSTISPKPFIKFVKATDRSTETKTAKVKTAKPAVKYAAMYSKPSKSSNDSSCSRHMIGNISNLSDYEPFDEGYVSFGQGGCKITGKGTIKTDKLEFENVYFVKDLKTPRQHNMYSINLNNIVQHKDLTCLVVKASVDKCMLWHRRLGHLNFKTMNKLVRHNLVRGLPTKCFENDHTCTACVKGKQHKASCKSKLVNSVTKPLHTLHMDLFDPTFVSSISHKWYCLVATDDFSRFTWTFFLKTKDETSGILRKFITEIDNLKDLKVKIIRCDNGGEFKNKEINDFCLQKGIKREFSNARTPQQNGVAEKRNRTLIEAARTMVLMNKSQNKTPYELFNGRTPAIGFLKPFGCHVMILNTLDNLRKFEAKGDEGYFIGYSMSSKAFRAFNKRTKRVEENLHVDFLENKAIEKSAGPNWLFDIDSLTKSRNYVPVVVAGTNSTNFSGTKDAASQAVKKDVSSLRYIALPNWIHKVHLESSSSQPQDTCNSDEPKSSGNSNPTATSTNPPNDQLEALTVETPIPLLVHQPIGTKWVLKNKKDERGIVIRNKARLVAQRHTQKEGIDYDEVFAPVARIEAIRLFLAYASFIGFTVYQMDVKSAFLYGTIDGEVEFEALMHEKFQMSAMGELNFFLGLQVLQKEDGIFLSQDKYVGDILKKFRYSDVRLANTPMDKENPWGKDGSGKDVDLHLYRSMIGSLMYLIASRPDNMFSIYENVANLLTKPFDAGRFQYLVVEHAMRDFVKGNLIIYTTYFWSTTRIETMEEGTKILATVDRQFSHQWKYLIHTIMQYMSPKSIGFNEFCSNIATALVCLATNRVYNFSKMIFYGMVKNVNNKVSKFLLYPRFLSICLRMSQFRKITHTHTYVVPFHTRKRFTTLRVNSPIFSGRIVPLFESMLVPQGEGSGTLIEPHHTPSPEVQQTSPTTHSSPSLPPVTTELPPTVIPSDNPPLRKYTRRTRIAQPLALPPVADEPASPIGDTSTLPSDSTPRVTSLAANEGSMQQKLDELTALCTSLQRQQSKMVSKFEAQELEINSLKAKIKLLEDKDRGVAEQSGDDAPIKGSCHCNCKYSHCSGVVSTASPTIPTAAPIFTTTTESIPYTRRKGKEAMIESETPKKKKVQEQIDAQLARELEEEMARDTQRMNEQIAWDADIARIHAEEELQIMIDGLDRNNETVANAQIPNSAKKTSHKEAAERVLHFRTEELGWMDGQRKGLRLEQESVKKLKTSEEVKATEEVPKEKVKEMMQLVPIEEHLDKEDLNQLWILVKESFSIRPATIKWKLYDTCEVHHVTSKDKEIFMLVEKDYHLKKGLAIGMISYKLQVENYSKMANDLILKIYKIASSLRYDEFPLLEQLLTANEDKFPLLIQSDATVKKIALLVKSRNNSIADDPGILKGARHFQRKYHHIRKVIQEREIVLKKVHIYDNVADPFTKPMSFNKHFEHAMEIRIEHATSLM
uniref:Retrovirus-related Pol polyprotein from transposon TNT 1-94 n=1 Tax=Tanacetum cinerariifolium TaxID=118510 RepID=A0A6L2N1H7_TANCI|nr:hypothetical protein [Tanacetum cinerariifolium]